MKEVVILKNSGKFAPIVTKLWMKVQLN